MNMVLLPAPLWPMRPNSSPLRTDRQVPDPSTAHGAVVLANAAGDRSPVRRDHSDLRKCSTPQFLQSGLFGSMCGLGS